jgi:hypothetical protein
MTVVKIDVSCCISQCDCTAAVKDGQQWEGTCCSSSSCAASWLGSLALAAFGPPYSAHLRWPPDSEVIAAINARKSQPAVIGTHIKSFR